VSVDRWMSRATWRELDRMVYTIRDKAASKRDSELYGLADHANALMRKLATEIEMEDRQIKPK
jgi:hypothetical protein